MCFLKFISLIFTIQSNFFLFVFCSLCRILPILPPCKPLRLILKFVFCACIFLLVFSFSYEIGTRPKLRKEVRASIGLKQFLFSFVFLLNHIFQRTYNLTTLRLSHFKQRFPHRAILTNNPSAEAVQVGKGGVVLCSPAELQGVT